MSDTFLDRSTNSGDGSHLTFSGEADVWGEARPRMPRITVIPLINVIFLLLIFFMATNTYEVFDIVPLDLPEAESSQVLDEGPLTVVYGQHGEVLVNEELIDITEIGPAVTRALKGQEDRLVTLKMDGRLPAQTLLDVMETIQNAGATNISLATQKP